MDPAFILLAGVATAAALMMVTRRNPVYSAVWLLVTFLAVAGVFIKLTATFLAAIHVLVYTGAILVLFVFVIMLLNIRETEPAAMGQLTARSGGALLISGLLGVALIAVLDSVVHQTPAELPAEYGTIKAIGEALFNGTYLLPFEAVSLLLTVGMIGAVVLAKREL